MRRREFVALASGSAWAASPTRQQSLRRGVAYLLHRQHRDGGWHSDTYGLLRSGQSLTPFVFNALLDAGSLPPDRVDLAVRFLERIAEQPDTDDYPCYAAALTLRAIVRTRRRQHPLAIRMVEWLRGQQMSPALGWRESDIEFGAWGIGGLPRTAPHAGHIDLSMTRHVLEALASAGIAADDPMMRHARVFVRRCRNQDGSFFFSTTITGANKAGEAGGGFLGYGTTTADGIVCLHATGDRELLPHSMRWLLEHDDAALPQGFGSEARTRYAEGLRYYYADAVKRAFRAAEKDRVAASAPGLIALQRKNGSWANPESLVKEDDPLIATGFAVSALA
jgi:hypothetical protein